MGICDAPQGRLSRRSRQEKEPDVERLAQLGLMRNLVNATSRFIPTEEGSKLLNHLDLEDLLESASVS